MGTQEDLRIIIGRLKAGDKSKVSLGNKHLEQLESAAQEIERLARERDVAQWRAEERGRWIEGKRAEIARLRADAIEHEEGNRRLRAAMKGVEIALARDENVDAAMKIINEAMSGLPTEERLARAIFESGGCQENRCEWGARPCCCQERDWDSARAALRGLRELI